jgi:hypothetical protein
MDVVLMFLDPGLDGMASLPFISTDFLRAASPSPW